MSIDLEIIWIQINLPSFKPFLVSSLYRPPSSGEHYFRNIFNNVEHAFSESRDVYILSDMNMVLPYRTCHKDDLDNMCNILKLKQLIYDPTRVTCHTASIIDHAYTSNFDKHISSGIIKWTASDHYMIFVTLKTNNASVYKKLSLNDVTKGLM